MTYEQAYEAFYSSIYRRAFSVVRNADAAEDVTAIVFVKLLESWSQMRSDDPAAIKVWLYRSVTNKGIDYLRQNKRYCSLESWMKTDERTERREATRLAVQDAVQALPAAYREVVHLKFIDRLTAVEGAELLGLTVPAFKSRLYRGRELLRRALVSTVEA